MFLLNLPLVALTVVLALRVLPAGPRGAGGARVDVPGMAAFALAAGSLTYALSLAGERRWSSPTVLALLAVAGLALAAFARIELRSAAPLLDLRLFARPFFSAAMACVLASTAAFAALVYTSVWLQTGLGLGPVRAGLALMPLALASFATSLVSGRRLHGRSPRVVLGTGLLLSGLGCAAQAGLDAHSSAWSPAVGLVLTGVGVGLMGPAMGAAVFAALPPERAGMAAGAMTTFRQLGQTLGVAAFGVLFQQGGAALFAGLNRVLLAAAAVGLLGAVLAYVLVPKPNAPGPNVSGPNVSEPTAAEPGPAR